MARRAALRQDLAMLTRLSPLLFFTLLSAGCVNADADEEAQESAVRSRTERCYALDEAGPSDKVVGRFCLDGAPADLLVSLEVDGHSVVSEAVAPDKTRVPGLAHDYMVATYELKGGRFTLQYAVGFIPPFEMASTGSAWLEEGNASRVFGYRPVAP